MGDSQYSLDLTRLVEKGRKAGRREMALEMAEWEDEQATKHRKNAERRFAHESSAVECRRRAGETDGQTT